MQITTIEIQNTNKINSVFPFIKDKMVIDFVNGLDVAQRLNQHQKQSSENFIKRNLNLLNGKTQMAQQNINDHLIVGLQACQAYFEEISCHQQAHAQVILEVKKQLDQTQNFVAEISHFVADLQEQVDEMNFELSNRIQQLEWYDRADKQINYVLSAWEAEQFSELSPMGQCFLVLDTLKWGDFGFYINQLSSQEKRQQLDTLNNRIMTIQKNLLSRSVTDDMLKSIWLTPQLSSRTNEDMQYALQYQGNWSWKNPENYGMAFTATQLPCLDGDEASKYDDLVFEMIDINRVSQTMLDNIFVV